MRTTESALAAKEPRKVVATRRKVKRARLTTWTTRRAHTSPRITLRAGMPEPGRLGSIFFGFGGPATTGAPSEDFTGRGKEERSEEIWFLDSGVVFPTPQI